LLCGETVTVGEKGLARISLTGGGQVEVLGGSSVRFARNDSTVQLFLETGSASFRSDPSSSMEALIADATIRSAPQRGAVGVISMETPDSALVLLLKDAGNRYRSRRPDGRGCRRISRAAKPDPRSDPQGRRRRVRAGRLSGISGRRLAIIALLIGGAAIATVSSLRTTKSKSQRRA
jgi:hypothetical protein